MNEKCRKNQTMLNSTDFNRIEKYYLNTSMYFITPLHQHKN